MARGKRNLQVIAMKHIRRVFFRFYINAHKALHWYGPSARKRRYFTFEDMIADRSCGGLPSDVPKGHCAVYVGSERSRFIIPTEYLNHNVFRTLLDKAEEEYGFDHHMGLIIPCEDVVFRYLTLLLSKNAVGLNNINLDELLDSPSSRERSDCLRTAG